MPTGNIQPLHSSTTVSYDNTVLSWDIEYFSDSNLTQSMGSDPYLKEGSYYLKISANQDVSYYPSIQIDAEGSNNDVLSDLTTQINPRIYYYTRTIVADSAAVGETRKQITIQGVIPSNATSKAAYTDTVAPKAPMVSSSATTNLTKPIWTWNSVIDAERYRYSFSDGANWVETTATAFTPGAQLTAGSYTLYVQAQDRAGNWSSSGSLTTTIALPKMEVKQGDALIPLELEAIILETLPYLIVVVSASTLEIAGADLNLSGTPVVQLSGAGAASFSVIAQPASNIAPAGSSTFTIRFTPSGPGTQTATVSIANNDATQNPYVFIITGTGYVHGTLTLDTWTSGTIPTAGEVRIYAVNGMIVIKDRRLIPVMLRYPPASRICPFTLILWIRDIQLPRPSLRRIISSILKSLFMLLTR
jgi:hypothetical protein